MGLRRVKRRVWMGDAVEVWVEKAKPGEWDFRVRFKGVVGGVLGGGKQATRNGMAMARERAGEIIADLGGAVAWPEGAQQRDPRLDPRPGDVLWMAHVSRDPKRSQAAHVIAVGDDGSVTCFGDPRSCTKFAWLNCAMGAEVLRVASEEAHDA